MDTSPSVDPKTEVTARFVSLLRTICSLSCDAKKTAWFVIDPINHHEWNLQSLLGLEAVDYSFLLGVVGWISSCVGRDGVVKLRFEFEVLRSFLRTHLEEQLLDYSLEVSTSNLAVFGSRIRRFIRFGPSRFLLVADQFKNTSSFTVRPIRVPSKQLRSFSKLVKNCRLFYEDSVQAAASLLKPPPAAPSLSLLPAADIAHTLAVTKRKDLATTLHTVFIDYFATNYIF